LVIDARRGTIATAVPGTFRVSRRGSQSGIWRGIICGHAKAPPRRTVRGTHPPQMIVALTGVNDPEAQEECRLVGFHSFIVKPLTIEVLHNLLAEARRRAIEAEG
jgi:CheY-like chemotaxis protein